MKTNRGRMLDLRRSLDESLNQHKSLQIALNVSKCRPLKLVQKTAELAIIDISLDLLDNSCDQLLHLNIDCPVDHLSHSPMSPKSPSSSTDSGLSDEHSSPSMSKCSSPLKSILRWTSMFEFSRRGDEQNAEEDEDEDGLQPLAGFRPKKRVSFSESLVEERCFRPNSTIVRNKTIKSRKKSKKQKRKQRQQQQQQQQEQPIKHIVRTENGQTTWSEVPPRFFIGPFPEKRKDTVHEPSEFVDPVSHATCTEDEIPTIFYDKDQRKDSGLCLETVDGHEQIEQKQEEQDSECVVSKRIGAECRHISDDSCLGDIDEFLPAEE